MPKKIIKVEDKKKKKTNNINKIKKAINDNPQAVRKITEGIGELIINSSSSNNSKNKKTSKKSSNSNVSKTIKTITDLLD